MHTEHKKLAQAIHALGIKVPGQQLPKRIEMAAQCSEYTNNPGYLGRVQAATQGHKQCRKKLCTKCEKRYRRSRLPTGSGSQDTSSPNGRPFSNKEYARTSDSMKQSILAASMRKGNSLTSSTSFGKSAGRSFQLVNDILLRLKDHGLMNIRYAARYALTPFEELAYRCRKERGGHDTGKIHIPSDNLQQLCSLTYCSISAGRKSTISNRSEKGHFSQSVDASSVSSCSPIFPARLRNPSPPPLPLPSPEHHTRHSGLEIELLLTTVVLPVEDIGTYHRS